MNPSAQRNETPAEVSREAKYLILATLRKKISELEKELKTEFEETMKCTERTVADIDGVVLGGVTKTRERKSWHVTDEKSFLAWVEGNHPEWLETRTFVPDSVLKSIAEIAKQEGSPVDLKTGEEIPGMAELVVDGYVMAKPEPDITEKLNNLNTTGALNLPNVLQLEGSTHDN